MGWSEKKNGNEKKKKWLACGSPLPSLFDFYFIFTTPLCVIDNTASLPTGASDKAQ